MPAMKFMDADLSANKLNLISSLFNGRKDVFAIHWQKGKKSGYMPAGLFDQHRFVFLLPGEQQFHLILETLDTEEATYLWHFDKDLSLLRERVAMVDRDLQLIRNKGRQAFLANPPSNFSRIVHDYTDERKGFAVWKDMLEERML
jgi:hypothetical protein